MGKSLSFLLFVFALLVSGQPLESQEFPFVKSNAYQALLRGSVLYTVTKEKVAEIAADFMSTYYGVQVGALETQELRQQPIPFWLVCFSDTVKGSLRQLFFVTVLPEWDDP